MKSILLILTLLYCSYPTQDITEEICTLYEQGKYGTVISKYGEKAEELPYKALFHVGLSYYKQAKDKRAIEIMDLCISKNGKDSGPLYIKGKSLNFLRRFDKAAKCFEKAIDIDGGNASYYAGLGDAYMSMNQLDKALESYESATQQPDCPTRPYVKIPLILAAKGKNQPALEAYYTAKDNMDRESEGYSNVLYKIGQFETMNMNYFDAKLVLEELIDLDPSYFKAYPALIQSNLGLHKYDEIDDLRERLYQAYDKGLLKYNLKEKFCYDQFIWDEELTIKAYERFESDKKSTYFKHIYEIQEKSIPIYSIQTRHEPKGAKPYLLQKQVGDDSYTYPVRFDYKSNYSELKKAVLDVINEKVQPVK